MPLLSLCFAKMCRGIQGVIPQRLDVLFGLMLSQSNRKKPKMVT